MARTQVPTVDPRDPEAVRKALRAIELILQEQGDAVALLRAQRALVPMENTDRAPDNAPVPTAITTTFNKDGSMTVELRWTYSQGERPATQTVVIVKKGTAPLKPPVYREDDVYTVPTGATYTRIDLPSEHNYRFGVAVARGTPSGLEVGAVQAPTANPDWADIGGVAPVLTVGGLMKGVVTVLGADVTLTEATYTPVGSLVVPVPSWAVDTKVLLTCSLNMGLAVTTAGIYRLRWRWRRNSPSIFTSNPIHYDSSAPITSQSLWVLPIGPVVDATVVTTTVTYSLEVEKFNFTGNNAVTVKAGSQLAASFWSY
jgi:hypothetical protein